MKLSKYITNVLIGFDQFINTIFLGYPDETISSRAWQSQGSSKFWNFMRKLIDWMFYFQEDHCYNAYRAEVQRHQIILNKAQKEGE